MSHCVLDAVMCHGSRTPMCEQAPISTDKFLLLLKESKGNQLSKITHDLQYI